MILIEFSTQQVRVNNMQAKVRLVHKLCGKYMQGVSWQLRTSERVTPIITCYYCLGALTQILNLVKKQTRAQRIYLYQ